MNKKIITSLILGLTIFSVGHVASNAGQANVKLSTNDTHKRSSGFKTTSKVSTLYVNNPKNSANRAVYGEWYWDTPNAVMPDLRIDYVKAGSATTISKKSEKKDYKFGNNIHYYLLEVAGVGTRGTTANGYMTY